VKSSGTFLVEGIQWSNSMSWRYSLYPQQRFCLSFFLKSASPFTFNDHISARDLICRLPLLGAYRDKAR
jgi:hypothetical protein